MIVSFFVRILVVTYVVIMDFSLFVPRASRPLGQEYDGYSCLAPCAEHSFALPATRFARGRVGVTAEIIDVDDVKFRSKSLTKAVERVIDKEATVCNEGDYAAIRGRNHAIRTPTDSTRVGIVQHIFNFAAERTA